MGKEAFRAKSFGWSRVGKVLTLLARGERLRPSQDARENHVEVTDGRGLVTCSCECGRKRKDTMRLYVENIPPLANEEALTRWFERAGLRVEAIEFIRDRASRGCAYVKIEGEKFPSKVLRHLNVCTFWGRFLDVRKADRETDGDWRYRLDSWDNWLAA